MTLPESAKELVASGALAHLVTLNEDGSPQVTCIWVGLDGDELVSGHLAGKVVCVVSGGNIDTTKLKTILAGRTP